MRLRLFTLVLAFGICVLPVLQAGAQTDTEGDRLREALRQAIAQARALEDQRATLQGQLAQAQQQQAILKGQVAAAQAETKKTLQQYRDAVTLFNKRLEERDQTLEKWKAAYEQAADVARAKDAERAQFEAESKAYKASTESCRKKNAALVKVDQSILKRYAAVNFGDAMAATDPAIGFKRVDIQNQLQDYTDKILDQKDVPSCVK